MDRYADEILHTSEDEIRMFEVPQGICIWRKTSGIGKELLVKAKGEELQLFSAVGYFAAKEIHDRKRILGWTSADCCGRYAGEIPGVARRLLQLWVMMLWRFKNLRAEGISGSNHQSGGRREPGGEKRR